MGILNFELLSHPINWLSILVMLVLAVMAANFIIDGIAPYVSKSGLPHKGK